MAVESSVRKGAGMLVSFIDFKKAYDRVDRGKLWGCLKGMGIGGRALAFLKAAYSDVSYEVKVGAGRSDLFEVSCGLRQGCILSPLLFSLFINSIVARLKEAEVGVKCGSKLISMLLYADDAVIFAEDEKSMRLGLDVLMGWCREWSVEVTGEKCGVMHMRRKGVKRTEDKFYVGEEEIAIVEEYKYLDIVEAHCYFVDIGRTDLEQICSRINNNDCRTFRPRRPLSTVYRTKEKNLL